MKRLRHTAAVRPGEAGGTGSDSVGIMARGDRLRRTCSMLYAIQ